MISSSGAEGIDLKNVRTVHLMESFWHAVRAQQVIGRAVRICSHHDLPEADRTVKVFQYLMTMSSDNLDSIPATSLIRKNDCGREEDTKLTPLTSDEYCYELSNIKKRTNDMMLEVIKDASIDCSIYKSFDGKPRKCTSMQSADKTGYSFVPDINKDKNINYDTETKTFREVTLGEKNNRRIYAMDEEYHKDGNRYAYNLGENGGPPDITKPVYRIRDITDDDGKPKTVAQRMEDKSHTGTKKKKKKRKPEDESKSANEHKTLKKKTLKKKKKPENETAENETANP